MKLQTTFLDPRAKREDDSVFLSISVFFYRFVGTKILSHGISGNKKESKKRKRVEDSPTAWARMTTVREQRNIGF